MSNWQMVKWTEARQVTEKLSWTEESAEASRTPPEAYYAGLRKGPRLERAVLFLGVALPRLESVGWAARMVRDFSEGMELPRPDIDALRSALLFIQDPTEPRRRAAYAAAERADDNSPERLAAMAVYLSGGSIAPEHCQPVPAPPDIAGRFSAAAILIAAGRLPDRQGAISQALDVGEVIAQWGLDGPRR